MSDFLSIMAESSRGRAGEARAGSGPAGLASQALSARPVVPLALSMVGFDLIAEAKLASPAEGRLVQSNDGQDAVLELASVFEQAGVAAVSVLTEPSMFHGHLDHLEAAARTVDVPVMRKDFLVDPIQVTEARAAGASGVLLIARLAEPALLAEMTDLTLEYGMFVLVEVFSEADIEQASVVFDRDILIGVNTRDLTTLEVDPDLLTTLSALLPGQLPAVAESGIASVEGAKSAAELGYRMALVGTTLVTSEDPGETARDLIAAGRGVVAARSAR